MKFTKREEKALREFMSLMDDDGCVKVGDWTSGTGSYTKNRALPPFVRRYERERYNQPGKQIANDTQASAMTFFRNNPRRQVVLVLNKAALYDFLFSAAHLKEF